MTRVMNDAPPRRRRRTAVRPRENIVFVLHYNIYIKNGMKLNKKN